MGSNPYPLSLDMRRAPLCAGLALLTAVSLIAAPSQRQPFFPIDDVRPGMVGIGRTVFAGETIEDFRANIIGVLRNVLSPRRDLILARLEGGPLATTGVIQGMSGSPVYIDGKLVGAVSYAIGSFPREPLAGITPIAEMTAAVDGASVRTTGDLATKWPAQPAEVFALLGRLTERAMAPLGPRLPGLRVDGPATLADLAPRLRPIGAAMVMSGFDPSVDRELRQALAVSASDGQGPRTERPDGSTGLRPGDPVGVSLIHGDLEMGATGTVTHVDGNRVYGFGHPFLNLGPTAYPMTRAHVFTVLPSLDSSMKIAAMGPVIGTMGQDRSTAVGGTLGAGPRELEVNLTLTSARGPDRQFRFSVLHDQILTPLFSYVAILNSLISYERQAGAMSVAATGSVSFGSNGVVQIDDAFTGDTASALAAAAIAAPVGAAFTNEFRTVLPEKIDIKLRAAEQQESKTIERVWLDTTRPKLGATYTLQVLLRDFRGGTETISLPVTMPTHATGAVTLLVADATTLAGLEQRDLKPGKPSTWPALLAQLNATKRNNRLYVRLITSSAGTVVGGETLPALPPSVRSILDEDKTVSSAPVSRTVVGSWEHRLDRAVRGSRELTLTLTSGQQ
jgi:SpoIVB peptidase S55